MTKKNLKWVRVLVPEDVVQDFHLLFNSSGFEEKGQLFAYLISKEILKFYRDSKEFNAYNLITRFKVLQLEAQRGVTRLALKKLTQTRNIEKLLTNLENQGHIRANGEIQDIGSLKLTLKSLILECETLRNVAGLEILKNKIENYNIPELYSLNSDIESIQFKILKLDSEETKRKNEEYQEKRKELKEEKLKVINEN